MCRTNNVLLPILIICLLFCSCGSRKIPFNFQQDVSPAFLKQTLEDLKKSEEKDGKSLQEQIPLPSDLSGTAHIYKTRFIEGWMEQDNFINLAVLNEERKTEFVSYDSGRKHIYDTYLILIELDSSAERKPFLLFTVQSLDGNKDVVTGFSKVYVGDLSQNTNTYLLYASRILSIKQKDSVFFTKETHKTDLRFLLNREPYLIPFDAVNITKIVLGYSNELSGNKAIEIPVDKVMGHPASLILRSEDRRSAITPIKIH